MGEKRAWSKLGKRTRLRVCSAGLSLSLFLTGCGPLSITPVTVPDIGWPEAAGQERENEETLITGFGSLSDEVREQTVPLGTALSELELPDTLEAYVAADTGDGAEDDAEPDDGDKDQDKDPDDGDDNGGETPGEGDDNNGEDTPGEGDDNNGGGTPGEGDDNNGGDTPGEGDGNNGGGTPGEGDGSNGGDTPGEDDNNDGETPDGDNDNGGSTPGEDGSNGGETPDGSDDNGGVDAPETSDSADSGAAAGFSIETGSYVCTAYASENPQDGMKAGTLTAAREERVTIEDITWESDPAYDGDTEGIYTFTPVLPEGYALSDGAELPQVTVTVEFQGQQLTPEQHAHMLAGRQDDPVLLTEEDIFADDPTLAAQAGGPRRGCEGGSPSSGNLCDYG